MAMEMNGEIILDQDESVAFVQNMVYPNVEALHRRDSFMAELDMKKVNISNGEIEYYNFDDRTQ